MSTDFLQKRLNLLHSQISSIRNSGEVAPANTWIQKFIVPKKNGAKYVYYRLMEACTRKSKTGKIQGKVKLYLGKLGSRLHKRYRAAIARRNKLQRLEKQYEKLQALYSQKLSQEADPVSEGLAPGYPNKPSLTSLQFDYWVQQLKNLQRQLQELTSRVDKLKGGA